MAKKKIEKRKPVKLLLPESLHRRVKVTAATRGVTMIALMNEILDRHLPKMPK